jgi:hypothetical protein
MLEARKPFFLCSCHDAAVDDNSRRRIVIEGRNPENASRPTRLCGCSIHWSTPAAFDDCNILSLPPKKRERGKLLKSSGQKYDVVVQRNAISDHDVPRVPRHLDPADPAVPADTCYEKPQARDARSRGNRAGISN